MHRRGPLMRFLATRGPPLSSRRHVAETSGAVSAAFDALLRRFGRLSQSPTVRDYTDYGDSTASPRSFYLHHLAAHSAALVFADVTTILNDAEHRSFVLTRTG